MDSLRSGARRIFKELWSFAKWIGSSALWVMCIYGVWQLAKPHVCGPNETSLACLRQWQSVVSAMIALFVASVGWRLSQASIAQSVKLATFNRLEILGDRYDEDWRALKRFESEFIAAKVAVDFHLSGQSESLSKHQSNVLDNLSFPKWTDPYWENSINHCVNEWREHYYDALKIKALNQDSDEAYAEHLRRIDGIFQFQMSQVKIVQAQRKELYDKDVERLG